MWVFQCYPTWAIPKIRIYGRCGWTSNFDKNGKGFVQPLPLFKRTNKSFNLLNSKIFEEDGSNFATSCLMKEIIIYQADITIESVIAPLDDHIQEEQMVFEDAEIKEKVDIVSLVDPSYDEDDDETASLGNYLSRPVALHLFDWSQSTVTNPFTVFRPWTDYFQDARVQPKIKNFCRIRAKMHLKFVMNASPFFYGALRVCYEPRRNTLQSTATPNELVPVSQLPGVWLTPQDSTGAELVLPYINEKNWINPWLQADTDGMGRLSFYSYSDLKSANGVSGAMITISVFAWLEDVHLAGPTTVDTLQSNIQTEGKISGLANKVATATGALSKIPFLGSYASAASAAANVVGKAAAAFGFSNDPVVSDVNPMVPKSFHAFANCETSMPNDKLSIDPKNETPLDNSVAGTTSDDPLLLSNFLRESYIGQVSWSTGDATEASLSTFPVTPNLLHTTAVTQGSATGTQYHYTPTAYAASLFTLWRGSIIYRFKIIKTQYHRGRLRLTWDPEVETTAIPDTETTCYTQLVDLDETDEFEFEVPYKAKLNYLHTEGMPPLWNSGSHAGWGNVTNGFLNLRIQNKLSAPTASSTLQILVFQRPGSDFQFAYPNDLPAHRSVSTLQSSIVIDGKSGKSGNMLAKISVGEEIQSIRPLLHRTSLSFVQRLADPAMNTAGTVTSMMAIPRLPPPYGPSDFQPFDLKLGSTAHWRGCFANTHPISWILGCFVGYRGSIVVSANVCGGTNNNGRRIEYAKLTRYPDNDIVGGGSPSAWNVFTLVNNSIIPANFSKQFSAYTGSTLNAPTGQRGMTMTKEITQGALSAVSPQYFAGRFRIFNPKIPGWSQGISAYDNFRLDTAWTCDATWVDGAFPYAEIYYAAGVDFNPVFFMCTPWHIDWGEFVPNV